MIWLVRTLLSLLFLGAGWEVYYQWRALEISISASELQDLHEAIRSDPEAPDYYFQLGLIHRDEPEHLDLSASRNYLEKALALNPHNWRYWLEAARCYEFSSLPAEAENAYLKAVSLNPRSAAYRWRLANFYLRSRKLPEALEQLNLTIDLDSSYRLPTLALLWKAEFESGQIETIWPGDLESQLILLSYLVTESAQEGGRRQPIFSRSGGTSCGTGSSFHLSARGFFTLTISSGWDTTRRLALNGFTWHSETGWKIRPLRARRTSSGTGVLKSPSPTPLWIGASHRRRLFTSPGRKRKVSTVPWP